MAATVLGRAPNNKGNIAIGAATQAILVTVGQATQRLTFNCTQPWYYTWTAVAEGAALGAEKVGPIDAGRWLEIHVDRGVKSPTIYIEATAAATLQVISGPV